ncbi:MAG: hypothetical protein QOJ94_1279 [Sphingomonadales bacterium]|jgi:tetratricopeptide (TPR) repeat protein|nr:hypothetical protein [Sphingomonadales bacterium]
MILLAALALLLDEPELPPCVAQLQTEPSACDSAIATENNRRVKARLLLRRAYMRNEKYQYEEALKDLDAAVAADPAYGVAWHERSYTHGELRAFAQALADSDRDVALRPGEADAYRERAFARHGLADFSGELEDRSKVAALEPKKPDSRIARGRAALWLGRFDEARADAAEGLTLAQAAGDSNGAAKARALQTDITLWTTRSGVADPEAACRQSDKTGRFGMAGLIGDCTAAFLAAKTPRARAELLTIRALAFLVAARDQAAAIDDQAIAVALDPGEGDWHANLGGSYVMARHSWAGKRELDIAIGLKDNWGARAERAAARYNLKDYDGAAADAKKSIEMQPNDVALVVLGDLARDRGDKGSAKLYWMTAYRLGERDDDLLTRLKGVGVDDPEKEAKR